MCYIWTGKISLRILFFNICFIIINLTMLTSSFGILLSKLILKDVNWLFYYLVFKNISYVKFCPIRRQTVNKNLHPGWRWLLSLALGWRSFENYEETHMRYEGSELQIAKRQKKKKKKLIRNIKDTCLILACPKESKCNIWGLGCLEYQETLPYFPGE